MAKSRWQITELDPSTGFWKDVGDEFEGVTSAKMLQTIRQLAEESGARIVADATLENTITTKLTNVTVEEALDSLCGTYDLKWIRAKVALKEDEIVSGSAVGRLIRAVSRSELAAVVVEPTEGQDAVACGQGPKTLPQAVEKVPFKDRTFETVYFITSKDGVFIDVNQAGVDLLGYKSKQELLALPSAEKIYSNPMHRKVYQKEMERHGYVKDFEAHFKTKDGTIIHCLVSGNAIKAEDGQIIGYEGIIKDITARMDAVRDLQKRHRELSLLNSVALVMNMTQNLEMRIGANIFYGDNGAPGSEFGGFIIPRTNIHSRSPNNAYLWFNYYF